MNIVYKVIDQKENKWYIGSKKDWDSSYKTSSKIVKHLYDIRPDTLEFSILGEFDTYKEAYGVESEILRSVDARRCKDSYNFHNNENDILKGCGTGLVLLKGSERTAKQKKGDIAKGKHTSRRNRLNNPMWKVENRMFGSANPMYGKNPEDFMTEEAVKLKRERQSTNNPMSQKEHRDKISAKAKIRTHSCGCGKTFNAGNYAQHICKLKESHND